MKKANRLRFDLNCETNQISTFIKECTQNAKKVSLDAVSQFSGEIETL